MRYDEQAIKDITDKYSKLDGIHNQLKVRLLAVEVRLQGTRAKEYLLHGVARRLGILTRCVHNIFTIFPVERTQQLESDALTDVEINLHAFFVNISGLFDNLAWVVAFENSLLGTPERGKLGRFDIGIFSNKMQAHFPDKLRTYLNSEPIRNWYSEYSKNYRDALAHRIPMYIPPSVLNDEEKTRYFTIEDQIRKLDFDLPGSDSLYDQLREEQNMIGTPSLVFIHSYEESRPAIIHQQVIIDYVTVEEALNVFCDSVWPNLP